MNPCENTQELISGYIDQELTQQKRQQVRVHIESCGNCKAVYDDLVAIQQSMGGLSYPECEEAKVDKLLNDPTSKKLSVLGWVLVCIPVAILFIYHLYTLITFGGFELWSFKTLFIALEAGLLLLFIKVIRQRMIASKTDRYNKVKL